MLSPESFFPVLSIDKHIVNDEKETGKAIHLSFPLTFA